MFISGAWIGLYWSDKARIHLTFSSGLHYVVLSCSILKSSSSSVFSRVKKDLASSKVPEYNIMVPKQLIKQKQVI